MLDAEDLPHGVVMLAACREAAKRNGIWLHLGSIAVLVDGGKVANRGFVIDRFGKLTLRRAGRLHHLGVGTEHANTPILMLVNEQTVDVINPANGAHLASHSIDPDRNYWRNTRKDPGRWPRSP